MLPAGASVQQSNCVHNWFPPHKYRALHPLYTGSRDSGDQGVVGSDCADFQEGEDEGVEGKGEGGEEGGSELGRGVRKGDET